MFKRFTDMGIGTKKGCRYLNRFIDMGIGLIRKPYLLVELNTVGKGSWVCPAGVDKVQAVLVGGGANGKAGTTSRGGNGGNGGAVTITPVLNVTPGNSYNFTVADIAGTSTIFGYSAVGNSSAARGGTGNSDYFGDDGQNNTDADPITGRKFSGGGGGGGGSASMQLGGEWKIGSYCGGDGITNGGDGGTGANRVNKPGFPGSPGRNAYGYGGGGGGGGELVDSSESTPGGSGYQGVIRLYRLFN